MKALNQACIIIAGGTGTGKSTLIKNIVRAQSKATGKRVVIYDVNGEHKELGNAYFKPVKDFLKEVKFLTDNIIVFEESTIFFRHGNKSEDILNIAVRKRHTQNIIIFAFHSLRQIPLYLLDFADFLFIKKTIDNPGTIKNKFGDFPEIIEAFQDVRESDNKYDFIEVNLSGI